MALKVLVDSGVLARSSSFLSDDSIVSSSGSHALLHPTAICSTKIRRPTMTCVVCSAAAWNLPSSKPPSLPKPLKGSSSISNTSSKEMSQVSCCSTSSNGLSGGEKPSTVTSSGPACSMDPLEPGGPLALLAITDPPLQTLTEAPSPNPKAAPKRPRAAAASPAGGGVRTGEARSGGAGAVGVADEEECAVFPDDILERLGMAEAGLLSEEGVKLKASEEEVPDMGRMPPWRQRGLMEDVEGIDPATLVEADAVYNKELSWLAFNWRVLYMALDSSIPLFERLRFLSISGRNLDEFFCKRVGALKRQQAAGVENLVRENKVLHWTPSQQLKYVAREVERMVRTQLRCLQMDLLPSLRKEGIFILDWDELSEEQKDGLTLYFHSSLEPILTPLGVDPGHPFPFIGNMALSIAVALRDPLDGDNEFAIVTVPNSCPRFHSLAVDDEDDDENLRNSFVAVEQIIRANLASLFGGMEILSAHFFRVTRNADVERNEEEAEDLLEMITDEMRERKFAPFVRLEVDCDMPEDVLLKLSSELGLSNKDDVYQICGPLALGELDSVPVQLGLTSPLEFKSWMPQTHPRLKMGDIFDVIRTGGDLLVHHPFHSFGTSTQHFVETASNDPKVRAIKATLYRTSSDSPVISALSRAAERGKQVAVLVELKARFDEERNVGFAQKLETAGCHVAYGLVGLKTHCKCIMVVREEDDGLRTYVHIGTGNYNPRTAGVYTDFGLFSCDRDLGLDVADLFKYLTGYHRQTAYRKLLVAPGTMRREFLRLIDREIANSQRGLPASMVVKCNGLDDEVMVRKIYEASMAGVKVDCIVRGMCGVRPGVPGVSDNVRVISIIGRFLEHHRIFRFENAGDPQFYIGSADWMGRNLTRRIEVVAPVENPTIKRELEMILEACLMDRKQAWELQPDGRYQRLTCSSPGAAAAAVAGASTAEISSGPASDEGKSATAAAAIVNKKLSNRLSSARTEGLHQALMDDTMRQVTKANKVILRKKEGSTLRSRRFLESLYDSGVHH